MTKPSLFDVGSRRYAVPVKLIEKRNLLVLLAGLGLAASLTLSGCAGVPSLGGTGGDGQSGTSDSDTGDSDSPPGDVNLDQFAGVPSTFPSDVPIISGDVPIGIDLGTGWSVVVLADDLDASYEEAKSRLLGAGFTSTADSTTDDGSFGIFENDKYTIQLTASDTADYGLAVSYVVVLKG